MIKKGCIGLVVAALLAACSGAGTGQRGDEESREGLPSTEAAASEVAPQPSVAGPAESVDPDDPLGFGEEQNTAVVVIDGERYEFGDLYCVTIGGALGAASVGGDPKVDINIPPEDWETSGEDWSPPSVQVNAGETSWTADPEDTSLPEIDASQSQVTSFTTDGFRASGTATFMNVGDWQDFKFLDAEEPTPVEGTFEVTCPES